MLFFAAASPVFATPGNIALILKETSFLAILALGFALAFTMAELDLSIAEVASLSAVVCGRLVHAGYAPGWQSRPACSPALSSVFGTASL